MSGVGHDHARAVSRTNPINEPGMPTWPMGETTKKKVHTDNKHMPQSGKHQLRGGLLLGADMLAMWWDHDDQP